MALTPEQKARIAAQAARFTQDAIDDGSHREVSRRTAHIDAEGRPFPFGREGRIIPKLGDRAPGYVRELGFSQPLMIMNLVRAIREKDWSLAPAEADFSRRLEQIGYTTMGGGKMFPLSAAHLWKMPGHEQDVERMELELKQMAMEVFADSEETSHAAKMLLQRKAMDPLSDVAGGSLIPLPAQGELIDTLRTMAVVIAAGAREVPLPPQGAIQYPRGADPTFAYIPSTATSIPESTPAPGMVELSARRAAALVIVPNDLIRYSLGLAESFVRGAMAQAAALFEDKQFLEGTGGGVGVQGIVNYALSANDSPTANKVTKHIASTTGTNGDTYSPSDVMKMIGLVEEAPSPEGPTAFVMRPLQFALRIANARADSLTTADGLGPFLFVTTRGDMGGRIEKMLSGFPVKVSTQVSNVRSKAGGTNLTYILCGDFRRALVGRVGAIEIAGSEHVNFGIDAMTLRAVLRHDFALTRPECFVLCDQLLP